MLVLGLFCAELLICVWLGISIICALLLGLVLFLGYGRKRGFSWGELWGMSLSGIKQAQSILIVLLLIGILTALWRACGTISLIICYAADFLRPDILVLTVFLLNCAVSVLTGTSFGTAATIGTICMTVALSMGADPVLTGGAILSGVYFGDRCSPVSTSALLVSELTQTDIYENIRAMLRTAFIPFVLTCIIYGFLGYRTVVAAGPADLWLLFGRETVLHGSVLLPAVLILLLSVLRTGVKKTMLCSIVVALAICFVVQNLSPTAILHLAVFGYSAKDAAVGEMLNGGGIVSMFRVAAIICISSSYTGIFRATGVLRQVKDKIVWFSERTTPFAAMLITSVITGMIACNQTLTILLTHQLCGEAAEDNKTAAIDLENSAVIVSPLVPWSIAGAVPLASVGARPVSLLFAFFLYVLPLSMLLQSFWLKRQKG